MIPNWLLRRTEVSAGAKLTYARLCQYAGENGLCIPRQTTLARELGVTDRHVRNYLGELQGAQLIASERHGLGRSNAYFFLAHKWIESADAAGAATSGPDRKDSSTQDRKASSAPTVQENQNEENPQEETHTRAQGVPACEQQATDWAGAVGVPREFATSEFLRLSARDWVDGAGQAVKQWRPYIRRRWTIEQSERAERAANPRARGARPQPARQFHRDDYKQSLTSF